MDLDWRLSVWGASTLIIFIVHFFLGRKRRTLDLQLSELIALALGIGSVVSSCSVVHKAVTSEYVLELMDFDILTLVLGAVSVIWVSVREIYNLFK